MHFAIEQITDLVVNAIPMIAIISLLSWLTFGGGLSGVIEMISTGWLLG